MVYRHIHLMDECRYRTTIKSVGNYRILSSPAKHNLLGIFTSKFIFKLRFFGQGNII